MKKVIFNNSYEKGKRSITQWFINEYVDETSKVFDGFAGAGIITSMYAQKAKMVLAIEKDKERHSALEKKFQDFENVQLVNTDSLDYLKSINSFDFNVVDLDPWGNANKQTELALKLIEEGYLLITSGEPYAISRFKIKIKRYGKPPITSLEDFPEQLFTRFVQPTAEKLGKKARLIKHFNSPKICRIIVEVN